MKKEERDIIKMLREGKRITISHIARTLNTPITTVADRLKRIEQKYVVKRASLIDYKKAGYQAHEIIVIKTENEFREQLFRFLKEENCVNSVYVTNSDYHFLIEVVFKDRLELVEWTEIMKQMFPLETKSYQILNVEEKEKFMP